MCKLKIMCNRNRDLIWSVDTQTHNHIILQPGGYMKFIGNVFERPLSVPGNALMWYRPENVSRLAVSHIPCALLCSFSRITFYTLITSIRLNLNIALYLVCILFKLVTLIFKQWFPGESKKNIVNCVKAPLEVLFSTH